MVSNNSGNGSPKRADLKENNIRFPVTYELKAVMLGTLSDEENKANLEEVFRALCISYEFGHKKLSSKGIYVSFTYHITLQNKQVMDSLYHNLKKVKGLKFAL